jgi:glycosyltransferase involved in cell wall biosynthesis
MPLASRAYRFYRAVLEGKRRRPTDGSHEHLLHERGVHVVHFPYPLHFRTSLPFVYEPWGLPHTHFPELYPSGEAEWMDRMFRDGCDKSALVITATRWVKEDIVKQYGIARAKIAVIPRRPEFDSAAEFPVVDVETVYDLPREFALFPAMALPTKNHVRLIQAAAVLRDRYAVNLPIVCTGRTNTAQWPSIERELDRLGIRNFVRFLGPIPYSHLCVLFKRARFLVFPSLFEGLGLPLLEAFHHGLPVVASSAACIPEVVGDAALLFNPYDVDEFAAMLYRAATDDAALRKLPDKGRRRLHEHFPNTERLAAMFVTCYRKAADLPLNSLQQQQLEDMTA